MKGLKFIGLAAVAALATYALSAPVVSAAFLNFTLPTFIESVGPIAVITLVLVSCASRGANRSPRGWLTFTIHRQLQITDAGSAHYQGTLNDSRMKNHLAFQ